MPGIEHNRQEEPVKLKKKGWAKNRYLFPILERIFTKLGIEVTVDGADLQQTSKGIHLKINGGGDDGSGHPFKQLPGSAAGYYQTQFAKVDSITPTIGGTPIGADTPPELAISSGNYPFLSITGTPLVSDFGDGITPNWKIIGWTVTASTITAAASLPSNTVATVDPSDGTTTDGTYYEQIAAKPAGSWEHALRYSLQTRLCDDGEGNGLLKLGVKG